ncbi:MAG: radical SAM protein [Desulfovibrionales bacterium]|nr:MAG: radical SAM protein [Desulfovibrionales bacterium]
MLPVLLVSPPWALFNRPSIQLGTLKAFLRQRFPELPVQAAHFHLQAAAGIGFPLYQAVSERSWIAESVSAALLYPEQHADVQGVFDRESRGNRLISTVGLNRLARRLDQVLERFIQRIDWAGLGLFGVSASLCQTTAALLLIRRVKRQHPRLPVVIGGASFSGSRSENLLALFPEIDHLVQGEGEMALAELAEQYCRPEASVTGKPARSGAGFAANRLIPDLDQLPQPDFDEYFHLVRSLAPETRFFPVLPVEASRGCWWQARSGPGQRNLPVAGDNLQNRGQVPGDKALREPDDAAHSRCLSECSSGVFSGGCVFCNLNLQWTGYRCKSPDRVAGEIDALTSKHKVLSVAFMDNLLPRKGAEELFAKLAGTGKNFRLFAEIRADTPLALLQAMYRAGTRELQVGIEALSTHLLRRMNKGVSALRNIEMMRHCEAMGMHHGGNLLLRFPGSTPQEVTETLAVIQGIRAYRPLKPVAFWLGLDSPVHRAPERSGIRCTGNHCYWFSLFPEHVARGLGFLVQGYRGGQIRQRRIWAPVRRRLREWERDYAALMRECQGRGGYRPILGYQDGRDFLVIVQRRVGAPNVLHRLTAVSRDVYLYCRTIRSRQRIQAAFPALPAEKLDGFLRMMQDKGLMIEEANRFLSLAIPMEPGIEHMEQ